MDNWKPKPDFEIKMAILGERMWFWDKTLIQKGDYNWYSLTHQHAKYSTSIARELTSTNFLSLMPRYLWFTVLLNPLVPYIPEKKSLLSEHFKFNINFLCHYADLECWLEYLSAFTKFMHLPLQFMLDLYLLVHFRTLIIKKKV